MSKPRILFLPVQGAGHMISMVEFAKLFLISHRHAGTLESRFSVTILLPGATNNPALLSYIQSVAAAAAAAAADDDLDLQFEELPPVENPTQFDSMGDFVSQFMERHKPGVESAISRLLSSSVTVAALIVDIFATSCIDAAHELNISTYVYFASNAIFLACMLYLPTLQEKFPMEFEEAATEFELPGILSPVPTQSMPAPLMNKQTKTYSWMIYHCRRLCETKGLIVNSFAELESAAVEAIADGKCVPDRPTPPVYPVGPILAINKAGEGRRHECLIWLDKQPAESVVFLCFGSMGSFEVPQVKEMSIGLERSGHSFLWVLSVASKNIPADGKLEEVMPKGFLQRNKDKGFVWSSWAPQTEILAHPAVGGFVTHCGWNSTLEGLWFGVPMLGWPLYAEQHLNSFVMAKDYGVAMELKIDRNNHGFVSAAEFERGLRCLMGNSEESRRVRDKVKQMKYFSRNAMKEGGSSFAYFDKLTKALHITP